VRLAALFAAATLGAVGLVGVLVYERHKREVEETVGIQLMNIARTGVLLVDPRRHAEARRTLDAAAPASRRLQRQLEAIRTEVVLTTPIYTLADLDRDARRARRVVSSDPAARAGEPVALAPEVVEPMAWTFEDGFARYTRLYRDARGTWITAFAPIRGAGEETAAVLTVDYAAEIYLDRLNDLWTTVVRASLLGALGALALGFLLAHRLTRPIAALTRGVARVAGGDLSQALPVRTRDEVGRLTRAFNDMLEGLRQRDFIRTTFGRYVSPEVVQALLESPDGLRFGGEKRRVTILMSDLRGYTRFAEQGDPAWVMEVLNGYLARMTDIVVEHGGTINEFIGDAIFAVFGAPLPHADHAERAAACALAMQRAMGEINDGHAARGLPRFEMGIGVNTGEAVVGNIGSEQRAKYAVVGSAVNVAARVEGATVGGQTYVSAATWEAIRDIAEVAPPVAVEVKGLAEPLHLYELRGLGGRWGLVAPTRDAGPAAEVTLPLTCWVLEGKVIRGDGLEGRVRRATPDHLDASLPRALPPLTNVRLRLTYPALGRASGDLYGKVVAAPDGDLTRIHLTALDEDDRRVLERLCGAGPEG
jgi:class 3 adenylate cyclase